MDGSQFARTKRVMLWTDLGFLAYWLATAFGIVSDLAYRRVRFHFPPSANPANPGVRAPIRVVRSHTGRGGVLCDLPKRCGGDLGINSEVTGSSGVGL